MKSFDLTFSGTVLPEHDPMQVKLAFGRLFCIEDTTELEEIFSGKTIVLRHNLDRKTAAEYFSRIAELGGKAALVESVESRGNDLSATTVERESARTSHTYAAEEHEKGGMIESIKFTTDGLVPETKTRLHRVLSENSDELARLRTLMSQMKEKSRQRYLTLQNRKKAFQLISDRELAKMEKASNEALVEAQSELATLRAREMQIKHDADAEVERLAQEQQIRNKLAQDKIASLETLTQEARKNELTSIADIEARRAAIRSSAEQEVRRIQQLLLDTQRQAELDDTQLAQELVNARSKAVHDIDALEQQRIEALGSMERDIDSLSRRQEEAKLRLASDTADQRRRQQEFQNQCREQSSRLHTQQLGIKSKRDRGIAKVDMASTQLETRTRNILKKLYAMELQAKRRQSEALESYQSQGLLEAESPEITSH